MRVIRVVSAVLVVAVLAGCSHAAGSSPLPAAFGAPFAARPSTGSFKSLYSFKGLPDGAEPAAGMVVLSGKLYGTTQVGGQANAGTVFTTSTAGSEHVLYTFGSKNPDGVFPAAGLVVLGGTFYGTTSSGGDRGQGTVFKISKSGTEKVLYSFKGGNDGAAPMAALAVDGGKLYGTTYTGGGDMACPQGCGTVFQVTTAGLEHVVHSFKGGSDGAAPLGKLVVVSSVLYGTTANGGKNGTGTIFKTSTSGSEKVLHSFGSGFDGSEPEAGMVNVGGKLYGTTNSAGKNFSGTVFMTTTAGNESVIYNFKGGSDGANPEASLIDVNGELYGTTAGGGTPGLGTVFAVSTSGNEHVVHAFKSNSEGSDPRAPLTAISGSLYGTTSMGGTGQAGTIFKAAP